MYNRLEATKKFRELIIEKTGKKGWEHVWKSEPLPVDSLKELIRTIGYAEPDDEKISNVSEEICKGAFQIINDNPISRELYLGKYWEHNGKLILPKAEYSEESN